VHIKCNVSHFEIQAKPSNGKQIHTSNSITLVTRMKTMVITVIINNGRMLSKEEERQYLAMWEREHMT